jgi:hypothetical protein
MTIEPTDIRAGDSVSWTVSKSDYKASDGWALNFALVGPDGIIKSKAGVANGADFDCAFTATETKSLTKGEYRLMERVSKGADAFTIHSGRVLVHQNLLDAANVVDNRAHAELVLAAIEATILGRAATDQENITINNQTLGRTPIPDLIQLRKLYKREVASMKRAETLAAGLGNKNNIRVRFI